MLLWELPTRLPQARIHWGDNMSSQVRTQPTRRSEDNWTKFRTNNKPTRTMEWKQIVKLANTRKGRDSSSNNKLRRISKFVTVNLIQFKC